MGPALKVLYNIGRALARPNDVPRDEYSRKQSHFNFFVGIPLFALTVFGFYSPIVNYIESTFSVTPEIPVSYSEWKVVYESGPSCGSGEICFADPKVSKLWSSPHSLADKDFLKKAKTLQGKKFWVGIEFDSVELQKIKRTGADTFVVGAINAGFKLYVNGDLRLKGDGNDYLRTIATFSEADLNSKRVRMALEVDHNLGSAFPVAATAPKAIGFLKPEIARDYRDYTVFFGVIRPLAMGVFASVFALIFWGLWLNVRDRHEYLAFGFFAVCLASLQALTWGSIKFGVNREVWYGLDLAFRICQGIFASFLGYSYARLRIDVSAITGFLGLLAFSVLYRSAETGSDLFIASAYLAKYFVPACFGLGAIACFSQASVGKIDGFRGMSKRRERVRVTRLLQFGALLAALGFIYLNDAIRIETIASFAVWHQPIQFLIVGLIAAFLLRDFREFDVRQQKVRQSKFHDPTMKRQIPVSGFLISLDMKKSTRLYEISSERGLAKEIPTIWNEAVIQGVASLGGEVISTAGDAVVAFFEGEKILIGPDIWELFTQVELAGAAIENEFKCGPISFRGAIVHGEIQPTFKELNGKLYEDFEHSSGKEQCFLFASRLLKLEKDLDIQGTVVVTECNLIKEEMLSAGISIAHRKGVLVPDIGEKDIVIATFLAQKRVGSKQDRKLKVA